MELACEKNRIWNEKSKIYSIKSEFKAKQIINYSFYLFKYVPVHPRKLHLRGGVQNDYNKGPFRPFRSLVGPEFMTDCVRDCHSHGLQFPYCKMINFLFS